MAPIADINIEDIEPMSRTYQYRKVMKPMLERKRRARMNKCLDDLKDLMVGALQHEGESITKLEKADVLELTVNHLKKLKRHNALSLPAATHTQDKFKGGFRQCTNEVTKFVNATPGIDMHISNRLLGHLSGFLNTMNNYANVSQSPIQSSSPITPPTSPITVNIASKMYTPPASPDNTRQLNPVAATPSLAAASPIQQSYNTRIPHQVSQNLVVASPVINNTNVTNITYKIAANQHYQQQQSQLHLQQQQQQQQQRQQARFQQHAAPPTPPLSVGSPSPVHHLVVRHAQQISPKPTSVSPGPMVHQLPAIINRIPVADSSVWRPW